MAITVLLRLISSGILDEFPNLAAVSPAVKRGPPTSGLSPLNWRSTPESRPPTASTTGRVEVTRFRQHASSAYSSYPRSTQ
jgi:hypothetical protein